ncbi:hypothetical protein Moror_15676 [Moniliophthora roreri MCA 2997]|uniref:Uncharacterized protein n=1 Tax=Moniliophthora roreri (strain MCA 2997) TaxID=1381753 RepID=V2WMR0_MONRO|nr:hypothetical protein Moror_15676 [Moniliophthora roreri MCA 2997]
MIMINPAQKYPNLSETALSLHEYLDPDSSSSVLPVFDLDDLSDAMKQITIDMEKVSSHADTFEEAAHSARRRVLYMQSMLNSCKNLLNPLVRMPPEVLTLVFELCVQADTGGHVLSGLAAPWVLSRICRRWRMIALSTPSLWQIIRLNTHELYLPGPSPSSLNIFCAWLERSQPLPIVCFAVFSDAAEIINAQLLDLFILHSKRWRAIEFCFGTQKDLYHRVVNIDPHMPLLQYVALEVIVLSESEIVRGSAPTWMAPYLKEATILVQCGSSGDGSSLLTLPWSQLEELEWSPSTSKSFLDISPSFTNLRRCYVNVSQHVEVDSLQCHILPQLRRLDMSGSYQSLVGIMDRLCLPALRRLDLDTDEQIGVVADQVLSSIARLLLRSSCHLQSLSAPFSLFDSPNSPFLAERLGTIQEVRLLLSAEEDNERAIANFLLPTMFRHLKTLHILFRELPNEDPTLFSNMVHVVAARSHQQLSRYGASRLEKLSVDVIRTYAMPQTRISTQIDPFQRLLRLQRDGLVLLGRVADGKWFSFYGDSHWSDEDLRMSARRWARFGYSDWLHRREVDDYLKRGGTIS